jgi:D-amino-acid dehydrogenase
MPAELASMSRASRHVAVIGAGIEGTASAIELLRAGHRVTLLDPAEPGGEQAASFGNAGWLSPMSVIPPSMPGLWRQVPRYLRDPLGPLAIRWGYLPRAAPWLARYLLSGWTEARVRRIARALRPLLLDAPALHKTLASEAGVPELIEHKGVLYAYASRAEFEASGLAWRIRRDCGIQWTELEGAALREAEPDLAPDLGFAVLVPEGGRCLSPGRYVAALFAHARQQGAAFRPLGATGFRLDGQRLRGVTLSDGSVLDCDGAVICCGARSAPLAAQAGDRVSLETERGYHVMLRGTQHGPVRSIMLAGANAVVNRMEDGLRIAGQVEIGGLDAAPDWRRAEILRGHLMRAFPGLTDPFPAERITTWMGHRPGTPDGMPCLGPASGSADIVHAFGHGHVGLASGARTGRVVAQLLSGQAPEVPIEAFSAARFR